jgi:hypothetical protein
LQFLFENPFLIIVLIGFIFSLFRKKEPQKDQRNTKPIKNRGSHTDKPLGEIKEIFKDVMNTFPEPKQTLKPKVNKVERRKKREHQENIYEKQTPVEDKLEEPILLMKQKDESATQSSQHQQIEVDEQRIVDAVIWSEILGPPRAKKSMNQLRNFK